MPLTFEDFCDRVHVSRETGERLRAYLDILTAWNRSINLVSAASLADAWRRHFLDSAQLLPHLPRSPDPGRGTRVADLGSGAGFPGMVLAILGRELPMPPEVHLIDSDGRKCAFLREAARAAEAQVFVHSARIETMRPGDLGGRADAVTARGCAPLDRLLAYAAPLLAPHGVCLFLKGRRIDEELTAARKSWNIAVERTPSISASDGVLLELSEIAREPD